MDIKQKFCELKEKVKGWDVKNVVRTKAFITVSCVMLVCVAVFVSTLIDKNTDALVGAEDSDRILGNALLVDSSVNDALLDSEGEVDTDAQPEPEEDFFAMAILNRTQVRDSALEVLREIADNPDSLPDAKEEALSSIASIADEMSLEANIETLVRAKGIPECVAVISGNTCSVIVNTSGLLAEELTQITDIVCEQAEIPIANITVVEAKK